MRKILAFEVWSGLLPIQVRIQAFWYKVLVLCILSVFIQEVCTAQYLPLSGGTLTGHLAGTTANFGTSLNAGAAMTPANNAVVLTLGSESNSANGNSVRLSFVHKIPLGGAIWTNAAIDAITHDNTLSAYGSLSFSTMHATTLSEKMRITSDGLIGIGTTTPATSFHLKSSRAIQTIQASGDHASLSLISSGNGGGGAPSVYLSRGEGNLYGAFIVERGTDGGNAPIFSGGNSTDVILGSKAAVPLKFGVNNDVKMKIDTDGNIGVGTNSPSDRFEIYKDGTVYSTINGGSNANSTTGVVFKNGAGANSASLSSYKGNMIFDVGSLSTPVRAITVLSSGNIGIGTESPAEKLSVMGKIRSQEIKVETANWPDYVFEPSYKLPELHETDKFIKENKHLPGIPSSKEVEKEGINLGEMNAKLLQKIEELTLHLISQDKKLTEQNERIKLLEKGRSKRAKTL